MSAMNGDFLPTQVVVTTTATVTKGSEPNNYLGVDLDGAVAVASRGVTLRSGDGVVTIALSGVVPILVATGATIAKGANVMTNSSGLAVAATAAGSVLGIAMEGVTTAAAGTYISLYVSPAVYVPAT
jgi:hypothetical protein